jgi:serine/threonine protein phosphatase 1
MSQITSAGRVKHFDLNTLGRDFAVGDIHGCYSELQSALDAVNFNELTDRLFSVGDLVDRGYESERSLEWLAKPWFHAIRGNHEEMFLHFYQKNMSAEHMVDVGGEWAVSLSDEELSIYANAFERLPVALDVQTKNGLIGFVHADCPVDSWKQFITRLPLAFGNELSKLKGFSQWSRDRILNNWRTHISDVHQVIVGHNAIDAPAMFGNVHFIDTGAGLGGYLTVIQFD